MSPRGGGAGRGRVRLSGGEHGGRLLKVPPDVRPTEGRVREALFAIWMHALPDATLLDLFAGSGAVALEAVGRGALAALCVEKAPASLAVLERNVADLGEAGAVQVRAGELPEELDRLVEEGRRFDLVFADPPYRFPDYDTLVAGVAPLLTPGGELAVEHAVRREMPVEVGPGPGSKAGPGRRSRPLKRSGHMVRVDQRRYGESGLSFYRPGPE